MIKEIKTTKATEAANNILSKGELYRVSGLDVDSGNQQALAEGMLLLHWDANPLHRAIIKHSNEENGSVTLNRDGLLVKYYSGYKVRVARIFQSGGGYGLPLDWSRAFRVPANTCVDIEYYADGVLLYLSVVVSPNHLDTCFDLANRYGLGPIEDMEGVEKPWFAASPNGHGEAPALDRVVRELALGEPASG